MKSWHSTWALSDRAILGHLDGERLLISDLHRFPNGPVRLHDGLHRGVRSLWGEIKQGIGRALRDCAGWDEAYAHARLLVLSPPYE